MLNKMCAQNNTTSVRSLSLDILRILACMAVITIHTPSLGHIEHLAEVGTSAWMKYIIPLSLSKWSVPVFMMLTGAFLIDPNRPFSYARLYRWRIPHILVVLVVWSLFYMGIVDHCFHYCTLTDQHHFWYLGMLVGLYLIIPMLRALVRDHKAIRCFCYTWLIYMVYDWIGNFFTLPIELIDNIFVDSIGYAAWGYYLTTIQWETANKSLCIWGGGVRTCSLAHFVDIIPQIWFRYSQLPLTDHRCRSFWAIRLFLYTSHCQQHEVSQIYLQYLRTDLGYLYAACLHRFACFLPCTTFCCRPISVSSNLSSAYFYYQCHTYLPNPEDTLHWKMVGVTR